MTIRTEATIRPIPTIASLVLGITLALWAVYSIEADEPVEAPPVEVRTGFHYEMNGNPYHLTFLPSDKKSEALIRKYRMFSLHHSLGSVLRAENTAIKESYVKHIIADDKIIVRDGYTRMTNLSFKELLEDAASQFQDLQHVPWTLIKQGLDNMGWIQPILDEESGEISDTHFQLHEVIVEHWRDKDKKPLRAPRDPTELDPFLKNVPPPSDKED